MKYGNIVVYSKASPKNLVVMLGFVAVFAVLVGLSLYKWFVLSIVQPLELMAELLVLLVLLERMAARYTYELDHKGIRLTKNGLLGKSIHEVAYQDILGVYRYKPQLLGLIKFRRTYRFHSATDGQEVWTLAYTAQNFRSKAENRRFYFKPGSTLLAALHKKLPDKVMISEEQVVKTVWNEEADKW